MPKQKKRLIQLPKETSDSLSEMTNKDDRDDYVRALRKAGWTLQSISDSIGVSRERVRQICEMDKTYSSRDYFVPEPPMHEEKARRVFTEPSEQTLARLKELQPMAQQVRSNSPRYRREAEEYTALLNHARTVEGVSIYRLALRLGVTHGALRFRLARYGYLPVAEGLTGRIYRPVKNRVLL
jgi:hypothetical protein